MKIIFLDIDGVLNSALGKGPYESDMETPKLELLKKLITDSGADGVVITSDRRFSKVDMNNKEDIFDKYEIRVLGMLRSPNVDDDEDNRGKQILDYLSSSKEVIERILILDDIDDGILSNFPEEFILINKFYGFNEESYKAGLEILK